MFTDFRSIIYFSDPKVFCDFILSFHEFLEAYLLDNERHSGLDEGRCGNSGNFWVLVSWFNSFLLNMPKYGGSEVSGC